jgi:hypothetical protein
MNQEIIQHMADLRAMFQDMVADGTTKEEFEGYIPHLDLIDTASSKFVKRLIQDHIKAM